MDDEYSRMIERQFCAQRQGDRELEMPGLEQVAPPPRCSSSWPGPSIGRTASGQLVILPPWEWPWRPRP